MSRSLDTYVIRFVLCLFAVLACLYARTAFAFGPWHVPGDYCSASDGARSWTREDKQRTRDRIRLACVAVGGSDRYCAYWDAVVCRESWCGVASAVHTQGTDVDGRPEYGLGALGLSVRWHADKWEGDDEDPAFCTPEVAFAVGHAIAWAAVERYGASNWVQLQGVFGGGARRVCEVRREPSWWWVVAAVPGLGWTSALAPTSTICTLDTLPRHEVAICDRLRERGVYCWSRLTVEDLGNKIAMDARREWAAAQVQANVQRLLRAHGE